MLKVKGTVRPRSLFIAAALVNSALELELPVEMLITSGNDGKHMDGSKHYTDEALDFRTSHLSKTNKHKLIETIKRRLGKAYDVILENEGIANEHGHAEWDPKE